MEKVVRNNSVLEGPEIEWAKLFCFSVEHLGFVAVSFSF